MGGHQFRRVMSGLVAGSLLMSATAAGATATAPQQQVNPWAVLSAMSAGAPAAVMCGTAAAAVAAQAPTGCVLPVMEAAPPSPAAAPPPPVPVEAAATGLGMNPMILGLLALAAVVGVAAALSGHSRPNSPR